MEEQSSGHLYAGLFSLVVAIAMSYLWADPKLRSKIHWGEDGKGIPLSNYSLAAWVLSAAVFSAVEFAWAFEAPLSKSLGNGLNLVAFALIIVGAFADSAAWRERGHK